MRGFLGFLGGLASLAEPMAAKLAVDTLGQHRSLAGPVALLAGVTIGGPCSAWATGHPPVRHSRKTS